MPVLSARMNGASKVIVGRDVQQHSYLFRRKHGHLVVGLAWRRYKADDVPCR
jgi:hypothetical protein